MRCRYKYAWSVNGRFIDAKTYLLIFFIFILLYTDLMTSQKYIAHKFGRHIYFPLPSYPVDGIGINTNINGKYNLTIFNSFCQRHRDIECVIPVYSSPEHYIRRQAIRDTIGRSCVRLKCAVFFIIGISLNKTVNTEVKIEHASKKDILVVSHIDLYKTLNNKVMAMLDWLIKFCPQPKYVLHIIDDVYPNIKYFIDHMKTIKNTRYILGKPFEGALPVRDPSHIWYAHESEYPYRFYPKYACGVAYSFLNEDCEILRDAAYKAEHMWVEDVWMTGLVRLQAGFQLVPVTKQQLDLPAGSLSDLWDTYFCIHHVGPTDFYDIYYATN